jgi:hypothetical protein
LKAALEKKIDESVITEGGHLFGGKVTKINQENVAATLDSLHKKLFPIFKLDDKNATVLGSTGKKLPGGSSGDIDLGIDLKVTAKTINAPDFPSFQEYAESELKKAGIEYKVIKQFNVISLRWPISNTDGKQPGKFVQVDLMPVQNLDYIKWGESSPYEKDEAWKSTVRNTLLRAIARYSGVKNLKSIDIDGQNTPVETQYFEFSPRDGLYKKVVSIEGKNGKLLKSPKTLSKTLYTDDVIKILKELFPGIEINLNDFTTTMGTWKIFQKTDLYKDQEMRDLVMSWAINELKRIGVEYPPDFNKALSDKSLLHESLVSEGGNAVSDASRINKANINATIEHAYDEVLKDAGVKHDDISPLGSVGKKDTSGDIDIGIDKIKDVKSFLNSIKKICDEKKIESKLSFGSEISIKMPISNTDGKQPGKFVQVDLMPAGNIEILKWGMYSPDSKESKYKGVVRNLLIGDIAGFVDRKTLETDTVNGEEIPVTYERYVLLTSSGLYRDVFSIKGKKPGTIVKTAKKISGKFVTDDPEKIVKTILGPSVKPSDVLTIDDLWKEFQKTDEYKNKEVRNKILTKTTNELKKHGLEYPSYLDER